MPFINLKDIPSKELLPGFSGKMIHTQNMTLAYWEIKAGSELPEHSHVHEQVAAQVISGEFELTLEGETKLMKAGDVAIIPSNATHSGRAITDCQLLDVFNPAREDYQ
ncbi:cupin domain-containing protein [Roseivirga sp. UBA838]|uniref:cupin domain-containing protein n=1 Tax=Roseivirga sp. UBA838 TaxID=1947393 RepID=UPI0025806B9A|nr:cupin domain-containing protein [Roseivirga sp. UBA838]|tara:strand:- start:4527 stop:4850 length:324 start_codon:yes stop_codon:yes gene_type:complete